MRALMTALMIAGMLTGSMVIAGEHIVSGKKLVLLPVQNDPTISFRLWFKTGSQNDPAGKEGLAAITAAMLTDASTKANNYEVILDKLFPLAAGYDASTSVEMTVVTGRIHKDNLAEYYPLLMDALLRPAFKTEDLDRIKSQVLNRLENSLRYSSDEELGKALLYNSVYAGTPYGHITSGTVQSVKSITVDDVKSFYAKHFMRDNVVIGLGGGYDEGLIKKLQNDLATLPAGAGSAPPVSTPAPLKGLHVAMIEKDAPATAISIGFPISAHRGSRDWYALAIATSWLGEHRNSASHLYQVIREKRGLNYGDYAYIEHFPNGGRMQMPPQNACRHQQIFEIWIRPVPNETRHFALRAAVREFTRLVDNGMTNEDFTLTRNFLKKYVLHYAPTTMERLGYALDDVFYGIDGSHLEKFRAAMENITLKDVNAAIRKYWQHENMQIAIVTKDAQTFKDALVTNAVSPITYKTPKPDAVLAEDKQISTFPLKIKANNVTILPVADMFER
ncbi:MAG: pitrilysin family protein [Ignavibacteriales bacterium]|nr:pitrilysin family protein [Ignavibacteriales bacterium]